MTKRNESQTRDSIKSVKTKYQFAVIKKSLLRVVMKINTYKTTRAKIETYDKKYKRFGGLSSSTDIEGCKAP